ncbi:barstar family protein [Stenotrophomonas sp.]|uniref:barstar family protein n=1 Tax=Stenotrophomonas sp. TaxID=69392 RepID=UPI00289B9EE5|nr:barstar family protein [Stenotrophomonas sp.]
MDRIGDDAGQAGSTQGMTVFSIDCSTISDQREFWRAYLQVTTPEGASVFGRNMNAFWDALTGGGPGWPGECVIRLQGSSALEKLDDGRFVRQLRQIAVECAPVIIRFE